MNFLVAESETREQRQARRQHAGKSSGETFADTLLQMKPKAEITCIAPADEDAEALTLGQLTSFDAVFVAGSPLHAYEDTPEVRRQIAFMRGVFQSGVPAFGSCAGLQLAVVAAGGRVRPMKDRIEAGVARRIVASDRGLHHPLLAGRPPVWDAAAIHSDEVEELPQDSILLAGNGATRVQAAEIRHGSGVFWGVQYHPELALGEIAVALRRQARSLVQQGVADSESSVQQQASLLDRLHRDPHDHPARSQLGVDGELAQEHCRRRELANFMSNIARLRGSPAADSNHFCFPEPALPR